MLLIDISVCRAGLKAGLLEASNHVHETMTSAIPKFPGASPIEEVVLCARGTNYISQGIRL